MSSKAFFGLLLFLVLAFGLLKGLEYYWPSAEVSLAGQELRVLVAKTPKHQYRGLGMRDDLGEYDGMIFVFPFSKKVGIVMRDMRFPIDIVWLERGVVVDIAKNVPIEPGVADRDLRVYYPRDDVNLVLELPAGWADEYGLKIGDVMTAVKK